MQHVVFARDRKRKKKHTKTVVFLMAVLSLFIGIVLTIKSQNEPSSTVPVTAAATPEVQKPADENVQKNEHNLPLVSKETIDPISTFSANVALMLLSQAENDALGKSDPNDLAAPLEAISHSAINLSQELTYIDIQEGELDEDLPFSDQPEGATSYEDEFVAEDDLDDETIQQLQAEAAKEEQEIAAEKAAEDRAKKEKEKQDNELTPEAKKALDSFLDVADEAIRIQNQFSYTVARGDKLKDVLEQSGLGGATARLLEKKFPQLANLTPGQQFYWVLGKDGELEYMNWLVSEKEEKIFQRKSKTQFAVQTIQKKGEWRQDVVRGTFNGDFSASLKAQGLSTRQVNQLAAGIQWQISTNKIKKGDKYVILVKREYINGKVTELGNVEAIHIVSGNKSYYAIQADNGRYYSRHGETLGKGFARYPLQFTPRVSSNFNPRRFHPVTRRLAPHKGVDFGVPIGTPIIAPADGVVEHVAYQANGAGRYIKIRHGGQYTTVYMHLSRQLVRAGQSVKKGERIAISGNTGRSTGPHLHYEFHINGHPVNPMTVKLPGTGSGMPDGERKAFLAKARVIEAKLKL